MYEIRDERGRNLVYFTTPFCNGVVCKRVYWDENSTDLEEKTDYKQSI